MQPASAAPGRGGNTASSSVLRASIDWNVVQERFLSGEIVVIDDVLSDWALDASYKFCLEATVFSSTELGARSVSHGRAVLGGV